MQFLGRTLHSLYRNLGLCGLDIEESQGTEVREAGGRATIIPSITPFMVLKYPQKYLFIGMYVHRYAHVSANAQTYSKNNGEGEGRGIDIFLSI